MASRNERRRRAARQPVMKADDERDDFGGRMMARAVRKGGTPLKKSDSKQIQQDTTDPFETLYGSEVGAVKPPLPLQDLLEIKDLNAIHSGCIEAKVTDSVGRGWHLENEEGIAEDDDAKAVTQAAREWLRSLCPRNPRMTFGQLVQQLQRERETTGWGAWEVGRDGDAITNLWPVPPHMLRATKDEDVYLMVRGEKKVYFRAFGAGPTPDTPGNVSATTGTKDWGDKPTEVAEEDAANEVLILRHYTPKSRHYGIPKWVSAIPPVGEFSSIRDYNISWFDSGGTSDRIVHFKAGSDDVAKAMSDDAAEQLEDAVGIGHTTLFTHGDTESEVNVEIMNPEVGKRDGQFENRREDLVKEILIGHQVPGYRVGWAILGSMGGSAAKEMLDSYRYGEVEPLQEDLEDLLEDTLFNPDVGGFDLRGYTFSFDDLDWSEMELEISRAEMAVANGLATPNEGREMIGLNREDDPALDLFYVKTAAGFEPIGVAPDVAKALDVVKEMRDALYVVVKGREDEAHDATAADLTAIEASHDESVTDVPDDEGEPVAEAAYDTPKKPKRKPVMYRLLHRGSHVDVTGDDEFGF